MKNILAVLKKGFGPDGVRFDIKENQVHGVNATRSGWDLIRLKSQEKIRNSCLSGMDSIREQ